MATPVFAQWAYEQSGHGAELEAVHGFISLGRPSSKPTWLRLLIRV